MCIYVIIPLICLDESISTLQPEPIQERGMSYLSVRIEKIGLKDAQSLVDPSITICAKSNTY